MRMFIRIVSVDSEGPAADAEVQVGDLILEIDHRPVKTVEDYDRYTRDLKKGDTVSLLVRRQAGYVALVITK